VYVDIWPDCPATGASANANMILSFFELFKEDILLYQQIIDVIDDLENETKMDALYDDEDEPLVKPLTGTTRPLFELRIPPRRPAGVARIYFCYDNKSPDRIILLDRELKTNWRRSANRSITTLCEQRYREMFG